MIQAFRNHLANRNIESRFINDEHSLLTFDIGAIHYLFSYDRESDPTYIRVMIPNIAKIDAGNSEDVLPLFQLAQTYKVGKCLIESGQLWMSADTFIYSHENLNLVFDRLISVLSDMYNDYRRSHNGQE